MVRLVIFIYLVLFLNGCVTVRAPETARSGLYHIVGSGQTLYGIAKAYNIDLKELMRVNSIQDPSQLGVGQELFIPRASAFIHIEPYRTNFDVKKIENIVGPVSKKYKWVYITVHHSGTTSGNAEIFDLDHRRRHMGGLAYHFVIGNGTGSDDGEIEVGWRWRKQVKVNRPYDLQICLVGNFNKMQVSDKQFLSLVKLISVLRKDYNISLTNLRRHKDIKGKKTDCPGRNFPFTKLKEELAKY